MVRINLGSSYHGRSRTIGRGEAPVLLDCPLQIECITIRATADNKPYV